MLLHTQHQIDAQIVALTWQLQTKFNTELHKETLEQVIQDLVKDFMERVREREMERLDGLRREFQFIEPEIVNKIKMCRGKNWKTPKAEEVTIIGCIQMKM